MASRSTSDVPLKANSGRTSKSRSSKSFGSALLKTESWMRYSSARLLRDLLSRSNSPESKIDKMLQEGKTNCAVQVVVDITDLRRKLKTGDPHLRHQNGANLLRATPSGRAQEPPPLKADYIPRRAGQICPRGCRSQFKEDAASPNRHYQDHSRIMQRHKGETKEEINTRDQPHIRGRSNQREKSKRGQTRRIHVADEWCVRVRRGFPRRHCRTHPRATWCKCFPKEVKDGPDWPTVCPH